MRLSDLFSEGLQGDTTNTTGGHHIGGPPLRTTVEDHRLGPHGNTWDEHSRTNGLTRTSWIWSVVFRFLEFHRSVYFASFCERSKPGTVKALSSVLSSHHLAMLQGSVPEQPRGHAQQAASKKQRKNWEKSEKIQWIIRLNTMNTRYNEFPRNKNGLKSNNFNVIDVLFLIVLHAKAKPIFLCMRNVPYWCVIVFVTSIQLFFSRRTTRWHKR